MNVIEMAERIRDILNSDYPYVSEISTASGPEVVIENRVLANFSSNAYLGLCDDPRVIRAQQRALEQSGTGAGSARLVLSHRVHRELEERIASFKGREDAVVFSTGMLTNMGVIPALVSSPLHFLITSRLQGKNVESLFKPVSLFMDRLSHACIYDGAALARGNLWGGPSLNIYRFRHRDVEHLRELIASDKADRKIIITDSVFSIHGRIAPIREIVAIAREFNAVVYLDEAHATWVLGPSGRGAAEMLGVDSEIDIPMGTLSKALGGAGGFVVGSKKFCDYLRIACRTYVFQTAMPPAVAAGLIEAIKVAEEEPWRRELLLNNAHRVRSELERLGFSTCDSHHHIVPVLIGDEMTAVKIARSLIDKGVYAGCIRYPAVPLGEAIIRCNMMATHTEEHLDRLVTALESLGQEHGVI